MADGLHKVHPLHRFYYGQIYVHFRICISIFSLEGKSNHGVDAKFRRQFEATVSLERGNAGERKVRIEKELCV